MAIVKNSSAPYIIHTLNIGDPIILDAGNVIINGNLDIRGTGTQTVIETVNTTLYDSVMQLNGGYNISPPSSSLTSGIEIVRSDDESRPAMQMLWVEGPTQSWQLSYEVGTYWSGNATTTYERSFRTISTYDPEVGQNVENVSDDPSPTLGGNLDVIHYTIFSSNVEAGTANVRLDSNLSLRKTPTVSTTVTPDYVTLTAGNVLQGGTGLYVTTDEKNTLGQELITKKRAIVYSIIF